MDEIKKHFQDDVTKFGQTIRKLIPHYPQMIEALILSIPFEKSIPIKVMFLGRITVTITKEIKTYFPLAQISCLELCPNTIAPGQVKTSDDTSVDYIAADFLTYEFKEQYDVILSSLALHHLTTDTDKKNFYATIFKQLKGNGIFYNADIVLGSNPYLQNIFMEKWKNFMRLKISAEEIQTKWLVKYKTEDKPAELINQLNWLTDIGFYNVEVIWKYYNFAVYGGAKYKYV